MIKLIENIIRENLTTSLIFAIIIGGFLGHYFLDPLWRRLDLIIFGEPEIIININEIHPLEENQSLKDFNITFGTANGMGQIVALQKSHPELNKDFGDAPIPDDFGEADNKLEYSIVFINKGTGNAKNIEITFSGDELNTNYDIDVSKKINYANCSSGNNCVIKMKKLKTDDKAGIFVRAKTPSLSDINCKIGNKGESFINFRRFYVKTIKKGEQIQMFLDENRVAELPLLNEGPNFVFYSYSPQENRWINY